MNPVSEMNNSRLSRLSRQGGSPVSYSNLRTIERKVLGALLVLSDNDMHVTANMKRIAQTMGYKQPGGAISFALQALEMKNFITIDENRYKVLL